MYEEFEKYIKGVQDNQIERYDSIEPTSDKDYLSGSRFKFFVRCSSKLFKDLIKEIRNNPNCSYDTYINDLIKSGYTPKFVSMLRKERNGIMTSHEEYGMEHFRDVCASRILNYFNCPTTHETMLNIDGDNYCCSVDFNKMGEDFDSIGSLLGIGENNLEENLESLGIMLENLNNGKQFKNFDEMQKNFLEEYVYSFLIRRYVLADKDCWFNNFGIIINTKDNTFRLAPNFDFEYCFGFVHNVFKKQDFQECFVKDLEFARKQYPKVYEKFYNKFQEFIDIGKNKPTCARIIEKEIGSGKKSREFIEDYETHLKELNNLITEFVSVREEL